MTTTKDTSTEVATVDEVGAVYLGRADNTGPVLSVQVHTWRRRVPRVVVCIDDAVVADLTYPDADDLGFILLDAARRARRS